MKNAYYFMLKAVFVLKISKFLSRIFGQVEKRLDQKEKLNFKIQTSLPGKQTIAIHVLPNISRSKGSQIMKFGYLYNRACVPYLETLNSGNFKNTFLE